MDANLRNLKDFLSLYNKVTELCFSRCVDNFNQRDLGDQEINCVNKCVTKFARFNQSMMSVYVEVQTAINRKRMLEMEENQKKLDAEAAGQTITTTTTAESNKLPRASQVPVKATFT